MQTLSVDSVPQPRSTRTHLRSDTGARSRARGAAVRATERSGSPGEDWMAVLRRLGEGDREALARVTTLVLGLLQRQGAYKIRESWEDICQEVLVRLVRRAEEGELRCPRAFVSYASVVTRGCMLDFIYRRARVTSGGRRDERSLKVELDGALEPEAPRVDLDLVLEIEQALTHLSPRTRRVIEAIYLEGQTYAEAAAALGLPLGTLKRLQTAGLRHIREILGIGEACDPADRDGPRLTGTCEPRVACA